MDGGDRHLAVAVLRDDVGERAAKVRRYSIAAMLAAGSALAAIAPIADGDVFWHLAAGREIVRRSSLLFADPFSLSASGRPWVDIHWLFQLGAYGVHALGGLTALVVAKCALVVAGALVFLVAVPRRARTAYALVLLATLIAARQLLLVRPVIVSMVLLAIHFLALERFRRDGRARHLAPLPFVQVAWANCQGLFALGPALVVAYAIGAASERSWDRLKRLSVVLALSVVASSITPFGVRALELPSTLFSRIVPGGANVFATSVAENVPPFSLDQAMPGSFWHLKWFLALLAVSFFVAGRRLVVAHAIVAAEFVALALMANRNVLLLYWMTAPIAAIHLSVGVRQLVVVTRQRREAAWLGAFAMAALVLVAGVAAAREPRLDEPTPFRFPTESARIIERAEGQGGIFAADHQGGYLSWQLYPRFRPYIDTRLVLHSAAEYADYLAIAAEPERFDALHERYAFSYVVLPVVYPDRYAKLIAHLASSMKWKLVHTDGSEVLFQSRARHDDEGWDLGAPETTDRIVAALERRFAGAPRLYEAARVHLAMLDIVVGELREAERVLDAVPSAEGDALRARCRFASQDLDGAESIGRRLLEKDARDVRTLDLLASVSARRGELGRAADFVKRALAVDPFDDEAAAILSDLEEGHETPRHEPR
jgi:hypothetical protein